MMATHWERGRRCWSHYLKLCLRKGTVVVDASLKLSNSKIEQLLSRLTELIQQRLPDSDLLEPDSPVSPAKPSSASPVKQQVPTPTPPSKQQVTTPTPPSKQQVPAPTPPSKQQVPAPTPPSKQQVPTTTPPSKYQVPGSSPPVKQQVPASSQMTHLSASDSGIYILLYTYVMFTILIFMMGSPLLVQLFTQTFISICSMPFIWS